MTTAGWQVLELEGCATHPDAVRFDVDDTHAVSGLLQVPGKAVACHVMAHSVGTGMTHPFMVAVADGLKPFEVESLAARVQGIISD